MKKFLLLFTIMLMNYQVVSQTTFKPINYDSAIYLIRAIGGRDFVGKIVSENDSSYTLKIENRAGESFATIPKKEVKEIKIVRTTDIVNGQYWGTIPNISYVLSPSGYSLRKGQWYFQNIWIIYNQLNVGVTNHIQVGVGGYVPTGTLWANVRLTFPIVPNKLIVGGSFTYSPLSFSSLSFANRSKFLIGYGFATIGSPNAHLTIGYGRVYNNENNSQFLYVISAAVRASKSVLLITENYIAERSNDQTHLLGMRTGKKNLTFTAGAFITNANRFVVIPWIGFGIRFGKKY